MLLLDQYDFDFGRHRVGNEADLKSEVAELGRLAIDDLTLLLPRSVSSPSKNIHHAACNTNDA